MKVKSANDYLDFLVIHIEGQVYTARFAVYYAVWIGFLLRNAGGKKCPMKG